MQDSDLVRPDEDWRGLGNPSERRKLQNRIAQRVYRRNMRERANQIEELQAQLRLYQDSQPLNSGDEDGTYQQSCSPSIAAPNKQDVDDWDSSWQPALHVAPSEDRYHMSSQQGSQSNLAQQQVHPAPVEQQSAISPMRPIQQQMECWTSSTCQKTVLEPLACAPSISIENGIKSNESLSLCSYGLSEAPYEDFSFDRAELVSASQQSTSLLHIAVAGNHIDTIKVLLQDKRIVVDAKDSEGLTPLQLAVMHGRSEIVRLLLDHSADTGPVRGVDIPLGTVGGFGVDLSK